MSQSSEQLWLNLLEAGLVEGTAPDSDNLESPWYVKILLGFSGWLAALFLLGFISFGLDFIIESRIISVIAGISMIGGAYTILRIPKNEFIEHLTLAISLAGQALIVFVIFDFRSSNGYMVSWLLVALLQAPLAIVMPN